MTLEGELSKRFLERLKELDEQSVDKMAGGLLQDFGEYRYAGGYRKGMADAKVVFQEIYEELMKE